jgi:hypothetical protein
MKVVLLAGFFILLLLVVLQFSSSKQEGFSFQVKTDLDGKMFKSIHKGTSAFIGHLKTKARNMTYAMSSMIPYKEKIRKWNRNLRQRKL